MKQMTGAMNKQLITATTMINRASAKGRVNFNGDDVIIANNVFNHELMPIQYYDIIYRN